LAVIVIEKIKKTRIANGENLFIAGLFVSD